MIFSLDGEGLFGYAPRKKNFAEMIASKGAENLLLFKNFSAKKKKVQKICTFLRYITEKRSGEDTMDKEEREVITNGKPALERLSKEDADLFYSVLLSQVQNCYLDKQPKEENIRIMLP